MSQPKRPASSAEVIRLLKQYQQVCADFTAATEQALHYHNMPLWCRLKPQNRQQYRLHHAKAQELFSQKIDLEYQLAEAQLPKIG